MGRQLCSWSPLYRSLKTGLELRSLSPPPPHPPTFSFLVGLVVKVAVSRAAHPGLETRFLRWDFPGPVMFRMTSKLVLQWLLCQEPGTKGAGRGLVGTGTGWPSVSML